jgi:16S rRNA processing protein RimM
VDPDTSPVREPAEGRLTVVVGVLGKAHALKGEVELLTGSDEPDQLVGRSFETPAGDLTVAGVRRQGAKLVIRFAEVADRTAAEGLRGIELRIPEDERRHLDDGEWWPDDLVGLSVVSVDGESIGTVADVVTGGPQDRLVVDAPDGRFEVPFVEALVPEVSVADGRVVVDLPEGLA